MSSSLSHDNTRRYWETADFWKDALERVVSSFLFAFAGLLTVTGFDFTDGKAWGAAAVAAGLSTVKALIGASRGRDKSTTPVSII